MTFDPPLFEHLVDPNYDAHDDWELAIPVPGAGNDQPPPPPRPQQQQPPPQQQQPQQPQQQQQQQPQSPPAAHNPDVADNIAVVEMLAQVCHMPQAEGEAFVAGALQDQPQPDDADEFAGLRDIPMPDFDFTQGGVADRFDLDQDDFADIDDPVNLVGYSSDSGESSNDETESSSDEKAHLTAEQLGVLKRKRIDEAEQTKDADFDPVAEEDSSDSDDIPLIKHPRGKTLRIHTVTEQQTVVDRQFQEYQQQMQDRATVSAVATASTAVTIPEVGSSSEQGIQQRSARRKFVRRSEPEASVSETAPAVVSMPPPPPRVNVETPVVSSSPPL